MVADARAERLRLLAPALEGHVRELLRIARASLHGDAPRAVARAEYTLAKLEGQSEMEGL